MRLTSYVLLSLAGGLIPSCILAAGRPLAPAIPLVFEPNQGQAPAPAQYVSRTPGYTLLLGSREAVMVLPGTSPSRSANVRMHLEHSQPAAFSEPLDRLPGVSNYFTTVDPKQWRTNIPQYGRVKYRSVYPGIDVVYYGNDRSLEYDFVVQPGGDPARIQLAFDGVDRLSVNQDGDLVLGVNGRELIQRKPVVYQEANGRRIPVAGRYTIGPDRRVRISLAQFDRNKTLVIDPTIVYSTYLGGNGGDQISAMTVDGSGNVYLAGTTSSTNMPSTSGVYQTQNPSMFNAAFVAKLNPAGTSLLYLTYLSGPVGASAAGLAVDASGNAYVTGAASGSFPTTQGAYSTITSGGTFVSKLSPTGSSLVYSTGYDGGSAQVAAIAVDGAGNAYITGAAQSGIPIVPSVGALQPANVWQTDAFIAAYNASGTGLIYSTYLGGFGYDNANNIVVDSAGQATIVGETDSYDFPKTSNAAQGSLKGGSDAFVARLNASGTALLFSTFLGGSGIDYASGLAVDAGGNIYVSGATRSTDFPTSSGAYQSTAGSGYLTKLNSNASAILFSTYYNPVGVFDFNNQKRVVAVDAAGSVYVAGSAAPGNPGVPVTAGALQPTAGGATDAFLLQFNSTGTALNYATYLGGTGDDAPNGLVASGNGLVYLAGATSSTNFPTTPSSVQQASAGGGEGFVMKIDMTTTACSYSLGASSQSFPSTGGTSQFGIAAPPTCPWSVSTSDPFVAISSGTSGSGNGTISFNVAANTSINTRSATISVGGQTFSITQAGAACSYTLGSTAATVNATGGSNVVTVSAPTGCNWTASSNNNWIAVAFGNTGSGAGFVQYNVDVNTGADRIGTMTIAGQTFTVTQTLGTCTFTLGSTSSSVGAGTGSGSLNVTGSLSACNWTATSSAAWLTVTAGGTGTGSGTVSYSIAANTSSQTRSATLTIGGQVYTVTQAGAACSYTLAGNSQVASSGGSNAVSITATPSDCSWTASSNSNWLTVSPTVGTGSGSVNYSATANASSQTRSGGLTIAGQTFSVTQAGVGCTFSISPASANIPVAGGTTGTTVTASASDCGWSASSNASWLSISAGASGTGNGPVAFSVAANSGTTSRTGTFSVAGQTFTVTQPGVPPPTVTLSTTADVALYNSFAAFSVSAGSTTTQVKSITLSANTGSVAYSSSISGSPLFLTVAPSSSTTPAAITLSANPAGLAAGTYLNTVTFSSGTATTSYSVALTVQPTTGLGAKVGIFRASGGLILLDRNGDGSCCTGDLVGFMGQAGDIPIVGDWSGDGVKKFGLYRPSTGQFLLDVNNNGTFDTGDKALTLAAQTGDLPVVGDWTGTGVDRVGVFRNGTWYLDVNGNGSFTGRAYLGQSGDMPLVGNWNGVGKQSKVGIYRPNAMNGQPGNFFLVDTNGDGQYTGADQPLFFLGQQGDVPILGDWNGDGKTKVGIYRPVGGSGTNPGLFILDQNGNFSWDGPGTDKVLFFAPYLNGLTSSTTAQAGDIPVTGNWVPSYTPAAAGSSIGQGKTRVGIYRPGTGTFFLDATADGTFQGRAFLGQSGDIPVGAPVVNGANITGVNFLGSF